MRKLKLKYMLSAILAFAVFTGGNHMANAVRETEKPTQPLIQYAHPLDAQAYTGNDLGAVYTKSGTTFKVWAPTASHVSVKLYRTGSDEEPGAQEMTPVSSHPYALFPKYRDLRHQAYPYNSCCVHHSTSVQIRLSHHLQSV